MQNILVVGVGGAIGSIGRYLLSLALASQSAYFPYGTLLVNGIGSFLIGVLSIQIPQDEHGQLYRLLLMTGVLGGFTTFSTFSLETASLMRTNDFFAAFSYIFLSLFLCLGGVFAGISLRNLF